MSSIFFAIKEYFFLAFIYFFGGSVFLSLHWQGEVVARPEGFPSLRAHSHVTREERSDEAIFLIDCRASLAMTKKGRYTKNCNICPHFSCTIEERSAKTPLNKGFTKRK